MWLWNVYHLIQGRDVPSWRVWSLRGLVQVLRSTPVVKRNVFLAPPGRLRRYQVFLSEGLVKVIDKDEKNEFQSMIVQI